MLGPELPKYAFRNQDLPFNFPTGHAFQAFSHIMLSNLDLPIFQTDSSCATEGNPAKAVAREFSDLQVES